MQPIIWTAGWEDNRLWARVPTTEGKFVWVGIPAPRAHFELTEELKEQGIEEPEALHGLEDMQTLHGFFKRLKRATRRVGRGLSRTLNPVRQAKALGRTIRNPGRFGRRLTKYAKDIARKVDKTVRHPALAGAVAATAAAFPALGVPAMKALNTARRITPKIRAGAEAANALASGRPLNALQKANLQQAHQVRQLISQLPPKEMSLLLSALQRVQ